MGILNFLSQITANIAADITVVLFLSLMTIGSVIGVIVLLCKHADDGQAACKKLTLALVLAVGFLLRLAFALCVRGNRADYRLFADMFDHLRTSGLYGYYDGDASKTLYPVVYFVYLIFGSVSNATGLSDFALGEQFMIKLPLIAADILTAFAVYKTASKYFNARIGCVLCAFMCVCPIFFVGSVLWTSPLAFTACFICFALYFLARKNYAVTIAFATLSAFSSKEGIYIFPIIAVFSIYHIVRAARNIKTDAPRGKTLLSNEYNAVFTVPISFVLSVTAVYLIGLFMTASYSYNIFKYLNEFVIVPLSRWKYFTYNGLSIYALFNRNGQMPSARFPTWVFVGIFAAILLAVTCVVYFTKRNRATMVMLAAYALFTMQIYYPGSSAVGMQLSLAALAAAYALVRDKRLLYVLFLSGLAYVVNTTGALAYAGYLNNSADYVFAELAQGYDLLKGGAAALVITCSALCVVAHLYFTAVTVSVGMTGQKKVLCRNDRIGGSIKEFFAGKGK